MMDTSMMNDFLQSGLFNQKDPATGTVQKPDLQSVLLNQAQKTLAAQQQTQVNNQQNMQALAQHAAAAQHMGQPPQAMPQQPMVSPPPGGMNPFGAQVPDPFAMQRQQAAQAQRAQMMQGGFASHFGR
jgi:hypothetical protein